MIAAVSPGGHFLTQQHTVDHLRSELWTTKLYNHQSIADWQNSGEPSLDVKVQERLRDIRQVAGEEGLYPKKDE